MPLQDLFHEQLQHVTPPYLHLKPHVNHITIKHVLQHTYKDRNDGGAEKLSAPLPYHPLPVLTRPRSFSHFQKKIELSISMVCLRNSKNEFRI